MNMNAETLAKTEEMEEKTINKVDFKMVTFTLAGKDYGIDIMKVKEIHKAEKFTFVPNSAPFVRGVYNMRGDIISVIDLRVFFNLPVDKKENGVENMIILRLEDHTLGVLVDTIEKVIGIDSSRKQPPHPLFGDINIKYIDGVVENDNSLYIILDAEKIFSVDSSSDKPSDKVMTAAPSFDDAVFDASAIRTEDTGKSLNIGFIEETLPTYAAFYTTELNRDWVRTRFDSWEQQRGKDSTQLNSKDDATSYLRGFYSPYTGELWGDEYMSSIMSLLPDKSGNVFAWNPGCSRGYETYSIAVMLKKKNPNIILRVQGNDNDLINISSAPGLLVDKARTPDIYEPFLVTTPKGAQFNDIIKDSVLFEYHDLSNDSALPPLDYVVCRDTLSHMEEGMQMKLLDDFYESMKPGGILILGSNERPINQNLWDVIENNGPKLYKKK